MNGNTTYGDYVPDIWDAMKLSRDFLLTLMTFIDQGLYNNFYDSYKNELNKKNIINCLNIVSKSKKILLKISMILFLSISIIKIMISD